MKKILLIAILSFATASAFADSEIGRSFRSVTPAAGVEHVIVDFSVGEVTIRTGNTSNIEISGSIRRDYDGGDRSRRKAREIVENTEVVVEVRDDRAFVRERRGEGAPRSRWHHSEIEVKITVPRGVNLDVRHSVGELDIKGDFRDVLVDMKVGEVNLRLPKKNVKELSAGTTIGEVHADVGDRVLSREGLFAGRTHYMNEQGTSVVDVRLKIGEVDISLD